MEGLKKFVLKGMTPKETIEQRVRRLKGATLPGVERTSLDLYCDDLEDESQAYTARLEMWLANGIDYRTVHARCASFDAALEKIQEYEACLIAGNGTTAFDVYEGKKPSLETADDTDGGSRPLWPFETRAEFTTFTDVLFHFDRFDKKGVMHSDPQTVADLPRLRHGMAVLIHLPKSDERPESWGIDWFDYAEFELDGKTVTFVCILDGYEEVFPLDPYSIIHKKNRLPKVYNLWFSKTRKDIIHALKGKKDEKYYG